MIKSNLNLVKEVDVGKILSTTDLKELMAEAVKTFDRVLTLHRAHFSEINLRGEEIPVSLDLDGAIIDGDFNLVSAKFSGNYISLDRAEIKGTLSLSGMKMANGRGIGLFLRGAKIRGGVILDYTKLNTIVVDTSTKIKDNDLITLEGSSVNRFFIG